VAVAGVVEVAGFANIADIDKTRGCVASVDAASECVGSGGSHVRPGIFDAAENLIDSAAGAGISTLIVGLSNAGHVCWTGDHEGGR
jgi:hypothetical protein